MKKLALLLSIVCILGGCQRKEVVDTVSYKRENPEDSFTIHKGEQDVGIHEFSLKDGTRCVTVYANGITCDWRH